MRDIETILNVMLATLNMTAAGFLISLLFV